MCPNQASLGSGGPKEQWNITGKIKEEVMSQSLAQHCRAGNEWGRGGVGTDREAVTSGLPADPGQILCPWATGSGPGTTLKSQAAAILSVPATSDLGLYVNGSSGVSFGKGWGRQNQRNKQGPTACEVFPGRVCHRIMS